MSSFKDVRAVVDQVDWTIKHTECSREFGSEARKRIHELAKAIQTERRLKPEQMACFNPKNELLERSQDLFDGFKRWLNEQPE